MKRVSKHHDYKIENDSFEFRYNTLAGGVGPIHLGLLCDAVFLLVVGLSILCILLSSRTRVSGSLHLVQSSLALLKVKCMVLGSNNGDEDDEGRYDTNEDNLNLDPMFEI
jgi:hypothetical protein